MSFYAIFIESNVSILEISQKVIVACLYHQKCYYLTCCHHDSSSVWPWFGVISASPVCGWFARQPPPPVASPLRPSTWTLTISESRVSSAIATWRTPTSQMSTEGFPLSGEVDLGSLRGRSPIWERWILDLTGHSQYIIFISAVGVERFHEACILFE